MQQRPITDGEEFQLLVQFGLVDLLDTLKDLIGSDATLTVGAIEDSVSALVATGNDVSDYVTDGVDVTVTDSVTIDQITAIDAQNKFHN